MKRSPRNFNGRPGQVTVEAAFCLPLLLTLMIGTWEVGRMVEIYQILANAAREAARYAATGSVDDAQLTAAMVQQNVRDYLTAAGLPAATVSGAQIQLTNLSNHVWTDPCNAQPMDQFRLTVTVPAGTPFSALQWSVLKITGVNQLSASATWVSLVDSQVTVNTQLPY